MISYLYNNYQHWQARRKTKGLVFLNDYYSKTPLHLSYELRDLPIVSLDFETTGLDWQNDEVVSIGLVELTENGVDLSTAWHQIINPQMDVGESSIAIHNINDTQAQQGRNIEEVLPELIERITGKVLLVHFKTIESAFLDKYCRRFYNQGFLGQYIDTMDLARRFGNIEGRSVEGLRLYHLHNHYGFPAYKAHNALMDAVTTAEVYFAQRNDYFNEATLKRKLQLKDVISR